MDETTILEQIEQLPDDWKWQALYVVPEHIERTYRAWLADAQRAEQQTVLRYWTARSTPTELDQAAEKCVFPGGEPWARASPGFHRFGISARLGRDRARSRRPDHRTERRFRRRGGDVPVLGDPAARAALTRR